MPLPSLSHLSPDPRLELSWNGVFIHIKLKLNFLSGMNKISLLINYVKDWGRGATGARGGNCFCANTYTEMIKIHF